MEQSIECIVSQENCPACLETEPSHGPNVPLSQEPHSILLPPSSAPWMLWGLHGYIRPGHLSCSSTLNPSMTSLWSAEKQWHAKHHTKRLWLCQALFCKPRPEELIWPCFGRELESKTIWRKRKQGLNKTDLNWTEKKKRWYLVTVINPACSRPENSGWEKMRLEQNLQIYPSHPCTASRKQDSQQRVCCLMAPESFIFHIHSLNLLGKTRSH